MNQENQAKLIAEAERRGWRGVHIDDGLSNSETGLVGIPPPPEPGFPKNVPNFLEHCDRCAPEYACWNGEVSCYKKYLPTLKVQTIFTVATLTVTVKEGEEQGLGKGYPSNTRTWGYYFTEAEAVEGMKRSCSDEAGYYTHAVIEEFAPGLYAISLKEIWFKWNPASQFEGGWEPCEKPKGRDHIINFGMG